VSPDKKKGEGEEKDREYKAHDEEKASFTMIGRCLLLVDAELWSLRSSLTAACEKVDELQDAHSSLSRSTSQTLASQKSQMVTQTRQTTIFEEELSKNHAHCRRPQKALAWVQIKGVPGSECRTGGWVVGSAVRLLFFFYLPIFWPKNGLETPH